MDALNFENRAIDLARKQVKVTFNEPIGDQQKRSLKGTITGNEGNFVLNYDNNKKTIPLNHNKITIIQRLN